MLMPETENRGGAVSEGVTRSSFWLRKIILSGKKSDLKGDCQPHGVRAPSALHTKQNSVDVCSNHISQACVGQRKEKSRTYGWSGCCPRPQRWQMPGPAGPHCYQPYLQERLRGEQRETFMGQERLKNKVRDLRRQQTLIECLAYTGDCLKVLYMSVLGSRFYDCHHFTE